jgi:hypothetical protein
MPSSTISTNYRKPYPILLLMAHAIGYLPNAKEIPTMRRIYFAHSPGYRSDLSKRYPRGTGGLTRGAG